MIGLVRNANFVWFCRILKNFGGKAWYQFFHLFPWKKKKLNMYIYLFFRSKMTNHFILQSHFVVHEKFSKYFKIVLSRFLTVLRLRFDQTSFFEAFLFPTLSNTTKNLVGQILLRFFATIWTKKIINKDILRGRDAGWNVLPRILSAKY